jgi:glucose-1-phosphate thymidylyltransferase
VTDKPATSELRYTWGCGCWGVRFTELLNHHLQERKQQPGEVVLADYFNMAIADGLTVRALAFNEGEYIDIGSPQDLESAVKLFNQSDPIVPRIS